MSARWEELLEAVVRERYGRLVAHACLVATPQDAPDLVQQALVATFSGRARFASVAQAEAYVRRAIVSRSVDESRRRRRERSAVQRLGLEPPPAPVLEGASLSAEVVAALHRLAPRERACVVLRHLEDQSVRETAALLGLSEGAVKRYTADAITKLGAALDAQVPADTVPVRPVDRREDAR